jgi:hypothetical protein
MPTPSDDAIAAAYLRHGLALIRAANGIATETDAELAKLATDIRYLLARATLTDMGRRALNALLSDIEAVVYQRYNTVLDQQSESLAELAEIESQFAATQSGFERTISGAAIFSGLLILGATLKDWWRKQAQDLAFKIGADIKAAQRAADPDRAAAGALFGAIRANGAIPRAGIGGELGTARRNANALTQTAAWAAANDARLATFRANGVKFVEWHAILDAKVCPVCALRAGKLWTIDGEPIKHEVPLIAIPCHPWDRCIFLPHRGDPPADGGQHLHKFDDWLATLTEEQENDLLGKGRAELYRRGVITLADLLNQNGQLLSLAELRAMVQR